MLRFSPSLFFLLFYCLPLYPQTKVIVEFSSGFPFNFPLPLTIIQSGQEDINLSARFSSQPLVVPIYWDWRISYCKNNGAWELESIHHKLFLDNKPPEVGTFSISHGLNLITINRSVENNIFVYRAGVGVVIAHPESVIRNKIFQESGGIFNWGYFFTGPVVIIGAGKRISLFNDFFANLELKFSAAYAKVPVYDGNASLYNIALHLNFGLGYNIYVK